MTKSYEDDECALRVANLLEDLSLDTARVGFEKDSLSAAHWEEI